MDEGGGLNRYCLLENRPSTSFDVLGLWMSNVHLNMTIEWSAEQFKLDYALAIGIADTRVDEGRDSPYPIIGTMEKHLKRTREGIDSRVWWYEKEFSDAVEHIRQADSSGDTFSCHQAAAAFGRGLHSWQDRSAHRPHPTESEWPPFVVHPAWWDDWRGQNNANEPAKLFNWYWYGVNRPPLYYPWAEEGTYVQFWQRSLQWFAQEQVEEDSHNAVTDFADAVRQSCVCRKVMLNNP